jgi:hypothetical protein
MSVNLVTALAGGRGTGKTDFTKNKIKKVLASRPEIKVLIIDTFDSQTWRTLATYDDPDNNTSIPIIEPLQVPRWGNDGVRVKRVCSSDVNLSLMIAAKYCYNMLVIVEDATRFFLNGKLTESQRNLVLDSKQKNVDLILVFHMVIKIPLELCPYIDLLTLFKTGEEIKRTRSRFPSPEIEKALQIISRSKNKHINVTLDVRP